MQESEFLSTTLQHKVVKEEAFLVRVVLKISRYIICFLYFLQVKELEIKLKEEERKSDPSSLHQKVPPFHFCYYFH